MSALGVHRKNRLNFCVTIFLCVECEKERKYSTDIFNSMASGEKEKICLTKLKIQSCRNATALEGASWLCATFLIPLSRKTFKFYDFNWFWLFIMRSNVINFSFGKVGLNVTKGRNEGGKLVKELKKGLINKTLQFPKNRVWKLKFYNNQSVFTIFNNFSLSHYSPAALPVLQKPSTFYSSGSLKYIAPYWFYGRKF